MADVIDVVDFGEVGVSVEVVDVGVEVVVVDVEVVVVGVEAVVVDVEVVVVGVLVVGCSTRTVKVNDDPPTQLKCRTYDDAERYDTCTITSFPLKLNSDGNGVP